MRLSMDLPEAPGPIYLSAAQRRSAALYAAQMSRGDSSILAIHLQQLGLAQRSESGLHALAGQDGVPWFHSRTR